MMFEWDEKKNVANQLKHGISFEQSLMIFRTGFLKFGSRQVGKEHRQKLLGELDDKGIILVVTTQRGKATRLISARKASKKERIFYYDNQKSIA